MKTFLAVLRDDEGATMVEYSIMVSLIAAVCIGIITTVGTQVLGLFTSLSSQL